MKERGSNYCYALDHLNFKYAFGYVFIGPKRELGLNRERTVISQSSPCSFLSWSLISYLLTWHFSKAIHYSQKVLDSVTVPAVLPTVAAFPNRVLHVYVSNPKSISRNPRFSNANMKITDDGLRKCYELITSSCAVILEACVTCHKQLLCPLILHSISVCVLFFLLLIAEMFLPQNCYKAGILNHWDAHCWRVGLESVKLGQKGSLLPLGQKQSMLYSWSSLLPFPHSVCRISQCCRAFPAAWLSAAGAAPSFARLMIRPVTH